MPGVDRPSWAAATNAVPGQQGEQQQPQPAGWFSTLPAPPSLTAPTASATAIPHQYHRPLRTQPSPVLGDGIGTGTTGRTAIASSPVPFRRQSGFGGPTSPHSSPGVRRPDPLSASATTTTATTATTTTTPKPVLPPLPTPSPSLTWPGQLLSTSATPTYATQSFERTARPDQAHSTASPTPSPVLPRQHSHPTLPRLQTYALPVHDSSSFSASPRLMSDALSPSPISLSPSQDGASRSGGGSGLGTPRRSGGGSRRSSSRSRSRSRSQSWSSKGPPVPPVPTKLSPTPTSSSAPTCPLAPPPLALHPPQPPVDPGSPSSSTWEQSLTTAVMTPAQLLPPAPPASAPTAAVTVSGTGTTGANGAERAAEGVAQQGAEGGITHHAHTQSKHSPTPSLDTSRAESDVWFDASAGRLSQLSPGVWGEESLERPYSPSPAAPPTSTTGSTTNVGHRRQRPCLATYHSLDPMPETTNSVLVPGLGIGLPAPNGPSGSGTLRSTDEAQPIGASPTALAHAHAPKQENGTATSTTANPPTTITTVTPTTTTPSTTTHPPPSTSVHVQRRACAKCTLPIVAGERGVKALDAIFHLDCFTCKVCNVNVGVKYFSAESPPDTVDDLTTEPATVANGRRFALCETHHLELACARCGQLLGNSTSIQAEGRKYHLDHFTCTVCDVPLDSYFCHGDMILCPYHFSTRYASRCPGCGHAILDKLVERKPGEAWHGVCHVAHKLWNIRIAAPVDSLPDDTETKVEDVMTPFGPVRADALTMEATIPPAVLLQQQLASQLRAYHIWMILSAYEESTSTFVSKIMRDLSSRRFGDVVRVAQSFILHVEVLLSAVQRVETQAVQSGMEFESHTVHARQLSRRIVTFFLLLSESQDFDARTRLREEDLMAMALELKSLARTGLIGALRLDHEHGNPAGLTQFLQPLSVFAGSNNQDPPAPSDPDQELPYGFRSVPRTLYPPGFSPTNPGGVEEWTDRCRGCGQTIEEACLRVGFNRRWHLACLKCTKCRRGVLVEAGSAQGAAGTKPSIAHGPQRTTQISSTTSVPSRASLPAQQFAVDVPTHLTANSKALRPYCSECLSLPLTSNVQGVKCLEQYAFLLRVALARMYDRFLAKHLIPADDPTRVTDSTAPNPVTTLPTIRSTRPAAPPNLMQMQHGMLAPTRVLEPPGQPVAQSISIMPGAPPLPPSATLLKSPWPSTPDTTAAATTTVAAAAAAAPAAVGAPAPSTLAAPRSSVNPRAPPGTLTLPSRDPLQPSFGGSHPGTPWSEDGSGLDGLRAEAGKAASVETFMGKRLVTDLTENELVAIKHMAVAYIEQSAIRNILSLDELLELIETRKNNFWNKWFRAGKDKKEVKKKGLFGVPLELLLERPGGSKQSDLGAGQQTIIPSFLHELIHTMMGKDLTVEGVFRKNGNIRRLKEVIDALDKEAKESACVLSDENSIQLAVILKKFLHELPDPLLTFKLHTLFVRSQAVEPEEERVRLLQAIYILLPRVHRDTVEVLFLFLRWVAQFSSVADDATTEDLQPEDAHTTGSKMDLPNLALVMAPNILYPKQAAMTEKSEAFAANRAVATMLTYQDAFWHVPASLEPILRESELVEQLGDKVSKDLVRKCERYFPTAVRSTKSPPSHAVRHVGLSSPSARAWNTQGTSFALSSPMSVSNSTPGSTTSGNPLSNAPTPSTTRRLPSPVGSPGLYARTYHGQLPHPSHHHHHPHPMGGELHTSSSTTNLASHSHPLSSPTLGPRNVRPPRPGTAMGVLRTSHSRHPSHSLTHGSTTPTHSAPGGGVGSGSQGALDPVLPPLANF